MRAQGIQHIPNRLKTTTLQRRQRLRIGFQSGFGLQKFPVLNPRLNHRIIHPDNQHFVIGQQLALNRLTEIQPMQHPPENPLILHTRHPIQRPSLAKPKTQCYATMRSIIVV